MNVGKKGKNITRIIACKVFKPVVEYLGLESKYPNIRMTYLPPDLHLRPQELGKHFRREIAIAKRRKGRIICLYGECFPGISDYCQSHGASKVPGSYCWEMFLGSERFERLLAEDAGTYFLEKGLILNFNELCVEPLELYDEEMRECCFTNYHRVLYVRQPTDPDIVNEATRIAEFLGLSLEIQDADYSYLEKILIGLL